MLLTESEYKRGRNRAKEKINIGRKKARSMIAELGGSHHFIRKGVYQVNWKKKY